MTDLAVLSGRLRRICAGLVGLAAATSSMAAFASAPDCGMIADEVERAADIPPGLLHAVALAESGRRHPEHGGSLAWPWTIRSGPDSYYLPSKEMALRKVEELRAAGRSNIDVGCMQINLGYHPGAFASLDAAFDPITNVVYGARFLKQLQLETRSWAKATGRYHTADPDRGQAYRARVYSVWRDLRRRQGRAAPMISEQVFVDEQLTRLAGGRTATGTDPGPSPPIDQLIRLGGGPTGPGFDLGPPPRTDQLTRLAGDPRAPGFDPEPPPRIIVHTYNRRVRPAARVSVVRGR